VLAEPDSGKVDTTKGPPIPAEIAPADRLSGSLQPAHANRIFLPRHDSTWLNRTGSAFAAAELHLMKPARSLVRKLWKLVPFKLHILEPLRRSGILPERIYRHLHFQGVFKVRVENTSFSMNSYGHQIENEVFWSGIAGIWEPRSLQIWTRLCKTAAVIYDVGANTGIYAMVAQAVHPTATVIAFEPLDLIFARLEQNAMLNGGTVCCVQAAVSDRRGTTDIHHPPVDHPYAATLEPEVFGESATRGWGRVRVNTIRLDEFSESRGIEPDLLKIDTEGHEASVIRGLGLILETRHPTILAEVLTDHVAEELTSLFDDHGYLSFAIDEDIGPVRWTAAGAGESTSRNVLFCQPRVAQSLGLPT
jgi:FkbM family methyltransferase